MYIRIFLGNSAVYIIPWSQIENIAGLWLLLEGQSDKKNPSIGELNYHGFTFEA